MPNNGRQHNASPRFVEVGHHVGQLKELLEASCMEERPPSLERIRAVFEQEAKLVQPLGMSICNLETATNGDIASSENPIVPFTPAPAVRARVLMYSKQQPTAGIARCLSLLDSLAVVMEECMGFGSLVLSSSADEMMQEHLQKHEARFKAKTIE